MIRVRILELLAERGTPERKYSLYWLADETGVSYPTIHRLAKKPVKKVDLEIVEKICRVLGCELGDLLKMD